ncbi:MAG TPA: Ppx/GppA phosphatase family protein [Acidobacteriota bacterium]|nr:Ppx/GppA phosphatase family protein [Acidobacteriota bacterium]
MVQTPNNLLAAIDIGSSAIRMDVAEVRPDNSIFVLDSLKKGVQLGKEAFTDGHLSEESIRAACEVLRDFKKVMDTYGVLRYRAVATSAVRESLNSETFLDRVLMSTGLDVVVIDGPEENRLTYSAVVESLKGGPDIGKGKALLVEVGGGSTDVTLLSGGEPIQSATFPLGSIRLSAGVSSSSGAHEQQVRLLKRQITSFMSNIRRSVEIKEAANYIALGGDVRFAARAIKGPSEGSKPVTISKESFQEFVDSVSKLTIDGLVQKYSLSYLDAETIAPALLTYLQLLKETQAQELIVSQANIRAGIFQDLAPIEQGKRMKRLTHQILSAARSLGRKYQYDERHAERVRELACLLFDELKTEQRMNDTHRLYLEVAALLHDIGLFVSSRGHHKHSYYLISSSELFGLRQRELEIIANVARYHRRGLPQRSHTAFISLERDERMLVSKLGAILRVANALDKEHLQKVTDLKVTREGDQVVLIAQNVSDLTMERAALASRSEFFTEIFGKKVILREAAKSQ